MAEVRKGRFTVASEDPFVVFLIGMRINRLLRVDKWMPVARAMPMMLRELYTDPSHGFLGANTMITWRGIALVQYWRSFDALERYARAKGGLHVGAWAAFNKAIGDDGSVGIWHETYPVAAGAYECVYGNMPPFGLGGVMPAVPATERNNTARERLRSLAAAET
jgi:hypothetical protein